MAALMEFQSSAARRNSSRVMDALSTKRLRDIRLEGRRLDCVDPPAARSAFSIASELVPIFEATDAVGWLASVSRIRFARPSTAWA